MDSNWIQAIHNRRMLRFNAEQLWQNLLRKGWERVPAAVVSRKVTTGQ
jgi:hypothetical protein